MIDFKSQIFEFQSLLDYQKPENLSCRDELIQLIYDSYTLSAQLKGVVFLMDSVAHRLASKLKLIHKK